MSSDAFPASDSTKAEWATHMGAKWRSEKTKELDKLGGESEANLTECSFP